MRSHRLHTHTVVEFTGPTGASSSFWPSRFVQRRCSLAESSNKEFGEPHAIVDTAPHEVAGRFCSGGPLPSLQSPRTTQVRRPTGATGLLQPSTTLHIGAAWYVASSIFHLQPGRHLPACCCADPIALIHQVASWYRTQLSRQLVTRQHSLPDPSACGFHEDWLHHG